MYIICIYYDACEYVVQAYKSYTHACLVDPLKSSNRCRFAEPKRPKYDTSWEGGALLGNVNVTPSRMARTPRLYETG